MLPPFANCAKDEFTHIGGKLELDGTDITKSRVEASIDAATINTREPQRDAHLKSADFLDVEKFPTLSFESTQVSKRGEVELAVQGELTIHGVTHQVVFDVEGPSAPMKDPWGNTRIGLSAITHINRKDFGLTWNSALETGGVLVGDDVAITLDVEFVKSWPGTGEADRILWLKRSGEMGALPRFRLCSGDLIDLFRRDAGIHYHRSLRRIGQGNGSFNRCSILIGLDF